jgi:hypothetical protein
MPSFTSEFIGKLEGQTQEGPRHVLNSMQKKGGKIQICYPSFYDAQTYCIGNRGH